MAQESDIQSVAVVGGGLMGCGIAESAARAGMDVTVCEVDDDKAAAARARIEKSVAKAIEGDKLDSAEGDATLARIEVTSNISGAAGADLVIESVPEDLELKIDVMTRLDDIVSDGAILATNTSSLPIESLSINIGRRERVIGLHFFSPVPVMKLVEVACGLDTSDATIDAVYTFARDLGKEPIRSGIARASS